MAVVTPSTLPFLAEMFSRPYRVRFNWLGLSQVLEGSDLISVAVRKLQICNLHKPVIDTSNQCVGFGLILDNGEGMRNGFVFVSVMY